MPELAEVEFYCQQWRRGLGRKVLAVELAVGRRVFRSTDTKALRRMVTGAALLDCQTHGKQMLFRFSGGAWLGLHLGMTGQLRAERPRRPAKHDHLRLRQRGRWLVFSDPRQFGRVLFHSGPVAPPWWANLPPAILCKEFTLIAMGRFLTRHGRAPIKAVLLSQRGFPGIGNWMADEVLWRAGIAPSRLAGKVPPAATKRLFDELRHVCRHALRTVGRDYADPPAGWLFHRRWRRGGQCPRDGAALRRDTIGGRTTCWCPGCQR